jgi:ectoine hydroxylase-related dioxygenase (phytanoyl-CoA dioxygenase family)
MMVESREPRVESQRGLREHFESDGFLFVRAFLSAAEVQHLRDEITPLTQAKRAGVRNLLRRCPAVTEVAKSKSFIRILQELSGGMPFAVRGIFFDKTAQANWHVPWHQDTAIAVQQRAEVPGFNWWSVKEGAIHVHPPTEVLEQMIAVRIHLDDSDETNGALKVIPGSHRQGKLDDDGVEEWKRRGPVVSCDAKSGEVLIMRPLLLHASSPSGFPRHRRVIHLEYAVDELPSGLNWFDHVA